MEIKCNVPIVPRFWNDDFQFYVYDRVRVLTGSHGHEYIGQIRRIYADRFVLGMDGEEITVRFSQIDKIRFAASDESFDNTPYFDEEEKEFWRTHWLTRDGLKEKTPEDIRMLEEFERKWSGNEDC